MAARKSDKRTSVSAEDYLRTIHKLGEGSKTVHSIGIAAALDVTKPSVSGMLRNLRQKGLVLQKPYGSVALTKKGLAAAKALTYKHRVIENFVVSVLNMSKEEAHEEAHRLEHAFSDKAIQRLYVFLKKPESCPHGKAVSSK